MFSYQGIYWLNFQKIIKGRIAQNIPINSLCPGRFDSNSKGVNFTLLLGIEILIIKWNITVE